jgi:hypothetical protein
MSLTITAKDKGLASNGFASGSILQTSWGFNSVNASQVFSTRSSYGHVPGKLLCSITPQEIGNKVTLEAHLYWGGWQGTDIAAMFRFYKRVNGGTWVSAGTYSSNPIPTSSANHGVGTGEYIYRRGGSDSNSSAKSDSMMLQDTVTSTLRHEYAVFWGCGYEAGSRTILWNRANNYGNSYNPIHTCTIVATEIKG